MSKNVATIGHTDKGKINLTSLLGTMDKVMSELNHEAEVFRRVKDGELRIVHSQRKRKLRKKGVRVWWEPAVFAYVWEPDVYWYARDLYKEPKQ